MVGPASRQRATAAGSLAVMKAAAGRMDGAAPGHGELLESQGQWRAAWWPFTSLVDAVNKSVAALDTAVLSQDLGAVKEAISKLKGPYSKLFAKFG